MATRGRGPRDYRPTRCTMGCGRNASKGMTVCKQCLLDTATGNPPARPMSKKLRKALRLDD